MADKRITEMSDVELSQFMSHADVTYTTSGVPQTSFANNLEARLADGRASLSGADINHIRQRQAAGWRDPSSPWYNPVRAFEEGFMFGPHGYLG